MNSTNFPSIVTPQGVTKERLVRKYDKGGKVELVMREYKQGKLRSGSKQGPKVTSRKQAIAIALNEKRRYEGKARGGQSWWDQLQADIENMTPRGPLSGGGLR